MIFLLYKRPQLVTQTFRQVTIHTIRFTVNHKWLLHIFRWLQNALMQSDARLHTADVR